MGRMHCSVLYIAQKGRKNRHDHDSLCALTIQREGTTVRRGCVAPQQIQFPLRNNATRRKMPLVREHSPRPIGMSIGTAKWCQTHKLRASEPPGGESSVLKFSIPMKIMPGHDSFPPSRAMHSEKQ